MGAITDIKGLYTPSANGVDISPKAWGSDAYVEEMQRYNAAWLIAQGDTLLQIANSTGGSYFHVGRPQSGVHG